MNNLTFSPPVIAHRGASGYAPENTLAAFIKATQLGIKWMEFDVMEDKDGLPIIFHDELLDRISNGTGLVHHYPYAFLKTLDTGKWFDVKYSGECILTLEQAMQFFSEMQLSINLEIKPNVGGEERLVKNILHVLKHYTINPTILFSSFSIEALKILRAHSQNCYIGLLLHEWIPDWESIALDLRCVSVHINDEIITHHVVQKIKSMGMKVLCYTVNHHQRARELYDWGVDAVFSDYPDKMVSTSKGHAL